METNTELLNRIEAHIKGRLAVAESRAASSELYEGKKIAYNSILGIVNSLRADLAATTTEDTEADTTAQARPVPADVQEAAENYERTRNDLDARSDNEIVRRAFKAGAQYERERMMKKGDDELEKMIDDFEDWDGSYSRADLPTSYTTRDKARFFANWQRERLMKEAPVADVIEMHGSTETGYPLELTLGISRIPNIEYHGGKVRVIIEEIKEK